MARNKYIKDYRLLETVDERGRIRVESQYIGRYYVFAAGAEAVRREKRRLLGLCALGWAAFLAALLPVSTAMHTAYISIPFAFAALPLGMLTASLLELPTDGAPMEHRLADRTENSLPPRALFTAALPAAALVGQLLRWAITRQGFWPGDTVFSLGALSLAVCGAAAYSRRRCFVLREAESSPDP